MGVGVGGGGRGKGQELCTYSVLFCEFELIQDGVGVVNIICVFVLHFLKLFEGGDLGVVHAICCQFVTFP